MKNVLAVGLLAALMVGCFSIPARASNTGSLRGRVVDSTTGAPIAGAKVTAVSPQQAATTSSDSAGEFRFISLSPDTYTVRAEKAGYDAGAVPGISVYADQSITTTVSLAPKIKTIANVTSRSAASLVRAGTT